MLPRKIFENLIVICVMHFVIIVLLQQLFDEDLKFIASNSESDTTILKGPYKCTPLRPGEPNFGDASIRHCPPRFKKHPENITIYL